MEAIVVVCIYLGMLCNPFRKHVTITTTTMMVVIIISQICHACLQAGQVRISTEAATLEHLAQQFWHRILAMADLNDDQQLSLEEFQTLMKVRPWMLKQLL